MVSMISFGGPSSGAMLVLGPTMMALNEAGDTWFLLVDSPFGYIFLGGVV